MKQGYFRHPTIHGDKVIFVAEDDLWSVSVAGGPCSRLTSNLGEVEFPLLSPDGARIAFIARDEGAPDVHVMDSDGGAARRLTFQGLNSRVAGWSPDGEWIYYVTAAGQPVRGSLVLNRVATGDVRQGPEEVPWGRADAIGFGPAGGVVLGRNTGDPARWKRYKGGTAGRLWLSPTQDAPFQRYLPQVNGNLASPMWLPDETAEAGRIYFLSDHEGIGNLYSCLPSGDDPVRLTHHADFYARFATWGPLTQDQPGIVYTAGADLYLYDTQARESVKIEAAYASPGVQRNRKFVPAASYLENVRLNPKGNALALTARGKAFAMGNHEGAVLQLGPRDGVRLRLVHWLKDGQRILAVSDELGEERLRLFTPTALDREDRLFRDFDFGRATAIYVNPTADAVALVNHRSELWLFNLETEEGILVDRSPAGPIHHVGWSPDGRWIAYDYSQSLNLTQLRLYRLAQPATDDGTAAVESEIVTLTAPVLHDGAPCFDPKGRFLYFLSSRVFNPAYDTLQFDLGFSKGMRPYLITLQADLPNPFVPRVGDGSENEEAEDKEGAPADESSQNSADDKEEGDKGDDKKEKTDSTAPISIDLEGIQDRIIPFPVAEGVYTALDAAEDRVFWLREPSDPAGEDSDETAGGNGADLQTWVFEQHKVEDVAADVQSFSLSSDRSRLLYLADRKLRVLKSSDTAEALTDAGPPRKTGWVNLDRVKVSIDPGSEWRQMFREAWRLQRDQFWTADMSRVDWQMVFQRYHPLVDRVGSRREFSDLLWEMQGELGTSHAYELGGDYRPRPHYPIGSLGARFRWRESESGYEIVDWITGDVWDPGVHSPLAEPGVDIRQGDILVGINGQTLTAQLAPEALLVNQAAAEVQLTLLPRPVTEEDGPAEANSESEPAALRQVTVRTLAQEAPALYRTWVNANRQWVHEQAEGRVGYLHIPDMGPRGFAEFHRGFLGEIHRAGMIVDLRFNGGGHVSELLLEKLLRRRIGFDQTRWGGTIPYPSESVAGPIVALTNEAAGSDGDIFSHCFKLLDIGPLVGMRTWGGVIGIWPRHALVDGSITTQPEFSFWFRDVGWKVENYGTDPDIEVDISPDDYRAGKDPQLARALTECLKLLRDNPPLAPDLKEDRPNLSLPTLPVEGGS